MKNKSIIIPIVPIIILIVIITVAFICTSSRKKQQENTENENVTIADKSVAFEVSDVIANSGEEITINIKMLEDSNFVAANFELLYDNNKMEYVKYEEENILEDGAMSIVHNDEDNDKVLIAYVGNPKAETQIIEKGDLISITFKIKESISNVEINPEFKCTTLKDKDGKDVQNVIVQGTITIQ